MAYVCLVGQVRAKCWPNTGEDWIEQPPTASRWSLLCILVWFCVNNKKNKIEKPIICCIRPFTGKISEEKWDKLRRRTLHAFKFQTDVCYSLFGGVREGNPMEELFGLVQQVWVAVILTPQNETLCILGGLAAWINLLIILWYIWKKNQNKPNKQTPSQLTRASSFRKTFVQLIWLVSRSYTRGTVHVTRCLPCMNVNTNTVLIALFFCSWLPSV